MWEDVKFFSDPKFLSDNKNAASGLVVLTVVDDNQGNIGRKLMNTMVSFSGAMRPCRRWVDKEIPSLLCFLPSPSLAKSCASPFPLLILAISPLCAHTYPLLSAR